MPAVDSAGNVYVVDNTARISVFRADGGLLSAAGLIGPGGEEVTAFDIDIDARGDRYLAHNGSDAAPLDVLRFDPGGSGIAS